MVINLNPKNPLDTQQAPVAGSVVAGDPVKPMDPMATDPGVAGSMGGMGTVDPSAMAGSAPMPSQAVADPQPIVPTEPQEAPGNLGEVPSTAGVGVQTPTLGEEPPVSAPVTPTPGSPLASNDENPSGSGVGGAV